MKLKIENYFELEVGDVQYVGTVRDLTKTEVKKIENLAPVAEMKKIDDLLFEASVSDNEKKISKLKRQAHKLKEVVADFDKDLLYKDRLVLSIESEYKDNILEVGSKYGYGRVFKTIMQDVAERAEKND